MNWDARDLAEDGSPCDLDRGQGRRPLEMPVRWLELLPQVLNRDRTPVLDAFADHTRDSQNLQIAFVEHPLVAFPAACHTLVGRPRVRTFRPVRGSL